MDRAEVDMVCRAAADFAGLSVEMGPPHPATHGCRPVTVWFGHDGRSGINFGLYHPDAPLARYFAYAAVVSPDVVRRLVWQLRAAQAVCESLAERVAAQSELLTRRSEKADEPGGPAGGR
jgi:hypothetical protein